MRPAIMEKRRNITRLDNTKRRRIMLTRRGRTQSTPGAILKMRLRLTTKNTAIIRKVRSSRLYAKGTIRQIAVDASSARVEITFSMPIAKVLDL